MQPPCFHVQIFLLLLAAFLESIPGSARRRQQKQQPQENERGQCNMTSRGTEHVSGYHGADILHPISALDDEPVTSLYCSYTFIGAPGQRILFHVKKLRVGDFNYDTKRCYGGYLKLWDGIRQPGRYPYPPNILCGSYETGQINVRKFSSQTTAEVEFYAEEPDRHTTFTLTYKYVNIDSEAATYPRQILHHMKLSSSSVCYWAVVVEDCDGFCDVISPGYPGIYPPNMECHYHIYSVDESSTLQLTFKGGSPKPREFSVRGSEGCRDDYIEIYDGNSSSSPQVGRFCGRLIPDITSSSGQLFISFFTRQDSPPYGFNGFHATAIRLTKEWHQEGYKKANTWCDWVFNASEGSVSSPDHWLPLNTVCTYSFAVHRGSYMEVILTIYGLKGACVDRIEVYESKRLVERLCSGKLGTPQPRFVYNLTADPVSLKYYSAEGQYQSTPDAGFWLSFRQIRAPKRQSESVRLKDEPARSKMESTSGSFSLTSSPCGTLGNLIFSILYLTFSLIT